MWHADVGCRSSNTMYEIYMRMKNLLLKNVPSRYNVSNTLVYLTFYNSTKIAFLQVYLCD